MIRHRTDPVSLFFGLLFTVLGGFLLVDRVDVIVRLHWALPLALIAVALTLMLSATLHRGGSYPGVVPTSPVASTPAAEEHSAGEE